jgi:predicted permease
VRPTTVDREIDEELRDFLARAAEDGIERGLPIDRAERAARVQLGSLTAARDVVKGGFWEATVATVVRDVRYGSRMLRRAPGFTLTAIATLALGIGATTALFSVAREVLLKPLPVTNPHELVFFRWSAPPYAAPPVSIAGMAIDPKTGERASTAFSMAVIEALANHSGVLSDVIAFAQASASPSAPGLRDGARGHLVTANYFQVLGLTPRLGRLLAPDDGREGAPPVVVISHRYWLRQFGGAEAAVGQTIRFGPFSAPVVGVAPAGFSGLGQLGDAPEFFMPLTRSNASEAGNKFAARMRETWVWPFRVFGRLSPGRSTADAEAALQTPFQAGAALAWTGHRNPMPAPRELPRLFLEPGGQGLAQSRAALRDALSMLAFVVGAILLIVCVNLINLMLARAETRHGEMAVRLTIGANRARLVRQLLTESLLLSGIGAVLGVGLASLGKDVLLAWLNRLNPAFVIEPAIDVTTVVFTSAVALTVGLAIGLAPAMRATRTSLAASAQLAGLRTTTGRAWVRRGLLVTQVALSLVLLLISGLLVRTLINLQTADVGFDRHNVLLFSAVPTSPLPARTDVKERGLTGTYDRLRVALQSQPGVVSVAFAQYALLGGDLAMPFLTVPGRPRESGEDRTVYSQAVSPEFFSTTGMQLTAGRTFIESDRLRRVAVVNETLARRFFPDGSALGRFVGESKDSSAPDLPPEALMEIVGIVRDAKYMTLRDGAIPTMFVPFSQNPGEATFLVRTTTPAAGFREAVQRTVRETAPTLAGVDFRTQEEQAAVTYARESHFASLSLLFAGLALVLTSIGLYGLLSYSVARRTPEIGLRMALGAQPRAVVQTIVRETSWLVAAGVGAGLVGAAALSRFMGRLLFGLAPNDPATIAGGVAIMGVVAAVAAAVPARRAARVDPVIALRAE